MLSRSLDEYQQNARWFKYHAHDIAYWQNTFAPEKPNLVFIHGFPSASWDWHAQWQYFEQEYNLFAFDLLGFGLSSKPSNYAYSVIEQADIFSSLMKALKVSSCSIVAHDYGVSVAQEILAKQENDENGAADKIAIEQICFLNGGLFANSHRPILTQKILKSFLGPLAVKFLSKASLKKSFTKIFGKSTPPSDQEIDILWYLMSVNMGQKALPKILSYIDERSTYQDRWVDAMNSTSISLGFINGIQDPISGEHMLERFQKLCPQHAAIGIDVGHYPQLEDARQVNELLHNFLRKQSFSKVR